MASSLWVFRHNAGQIGLLPELRIYWVETRAAGTGFRLFSPLFVIIDPFLIDASHQDNAGTVPPFPLFEKMACIYAAAIPPGNVCPRRKPS
jgi:hypothetical protein